MLYKLVGVIERVVVDTFNLEVEADNPEEAQDLAYEVLSEYPNSELVVNRLLRVATTPERPVSIALEFQREELQQEAPLVEDLVFDGENDDGDDPGPRYA